MIWKTAKDKLIEHLEAELARTREIILDYDARLDLTVKECAKAIDAAYEASKAAKPKPETPRHPRFVTERQRCEWKQEQSRQRVIQSQSRLADRPLPQTAPEVPLRQAPAANGNAAS